jgi:NAD(P)-dependent dehydrogenase (short-subunit alcohol dehydrogenase family)
MPKIMQKIALVTGSSRGIGLETARQLATQGVHVFLAGRHRDKLADVARRLQMTGLTVDACELDVTCSSTIAAAAAAIEARFGCLDILVNNAAIRVEPYGKQPSEQPLRLWRETFETNLFGLVDVTQSFLPLLRQSPAGRIVNVSSLLASLNSHSDRTSYCYSPMFKSLPAYSASKSAVNSWTVHLAYELRDTPIKVNAVHPGYTKTDMNNGDGELDVQAGAKTSVRMALLDINGPTGTYVHMDDALPW